MNEPDPLKWPPGKDDWEPILLFVRTVCRQVIRSYRLDDNDLADAIQTACMGLCSAKKPPHFESWNQLSVWVRTVARHHVIAKHRHRSRCVSMPEPPQAADPHDPEAPLITADLLGSLTDPDQREAVRLRYLESFTYKEIAARMGGSDTKAYRRVEEALGTLRRRGSDG